MLLGFSLAIIAHKINLVGYDIPRLCTTAHVAHDNKSYDLYMNSTLGVIILYCKAGLLNLYSTATQIFPRNLIATLAGPN